MKVVTWQSPSGQRISICLVCEERLKATHEWPKDSQGGEYCQVHHGLQTGACELCDEDDEEPSPAQEIKDMFAPVHQAIDELIASRRVAELGTPAPYGWESTDLPQGVAVDVAPVDRPVLVDDLGRPWTVREILEREG